MGRIGLISSIEANTGDGDDVPDVILDPGAGDELKVPMFSAPGDDSRPLPGDYVGTISHPGDEGQTAVAYASPGVESIAVDGEVRRFARDSDGKVVCEYHFKNDGSFEFKNENTTLTVESGGTIVIDSSESVNIQSADAITIRGDSEVTIESSGTVTINGALTVDP